MTIARGPKPAQVLRELGVAGYVNVPEPNTWREVHAAIEARVPLAGLRVAVQEHGALADARQRDRATADLQLT